MLVLDSGAVSRLSSPTKTAQAVITSFVRVGLWPAVIPTVVLVESLRGDGVRDARVHRFTMTCLIDSEVPPKLAARAAELRRRAGTGSAVDAIVVALAEPGGTVLTGDRADLEALASYADRVTVEVI